MTVSFRKGKKRTYVLRTLVPKQLYSSFINAGSIGRYWNKNIRGRY